MEKNNLKELLDEQMKMEEMMFKVIDLMEKLDKIEEESIEKVYENKAKVDRIINYFRTFNSYDFSKIQKIYMLIGNNYQIKKHLETFFEGLQDFIFQLNIFTNTFVENLINYEMTKKLLPQSFLKKSARDVSYELENIDIKIKLDFVREELYKLTGLKSFKGSFTQISRSMMPLKFNYYDFCNTNGKIKVLGKLEKYLFYRQLYFRFNKYSEELGKKDKTENFDIMFFNFLQSYLGRNDIFSLKAFISGLYIILHNYSLETKDSRIILKSMFNSFNIKINIKGEVKIEMIDILLKSKSELGIDNKFINDLKNIKGKILESINILDKGEYPKEIEDFKKECNLTNKEFEYFKDFRFFSLYKDGSHILEKYNKSILLKNIDKKISKNKYGDILERFGFYVSSVYNSYGKFNKKNIKKLEDSIIKNINFEKTNLPRFFQDDLIYMLDIIKGIKF